VDTGIYRFGRNAHLCEEAYAYWVRRFVQQQGQRHPRDLGVLEVAAFIRHLAEEKRAAAATQTQALAALLFLYREVLGRPLHLPGVIPARACRAGSRRC